MKFCFWGHIASALRGNTIGGGELQMALLAKSLVKEGHEVVVIDPFASVSFVSEEGIQILHVPGWNKGLPGFRIFWYRIPSLYRMFVKVKADYYYVRMRSYLNILSYMASRKVNAQFILALASDVDLLSMREKYKAHYKEKFNLIQYLTEWMPGDFVFNYLLKRAEFVTCQHSGQRELLKKVRGKVVEFPNIVNLQNLPSGTKAVNGKSFIYCGSLTGLKGSDKLYELIKDAGKKNHFTIVGQPNDKPSEPLFDKINLLPGADVKGRRQHCETLELLANAKALINVSRYEGFPNVFLEAWAMGIPVLSLKVNPGNIFDKFNFLGVCFDGDLSKMKEYIANGNYLAYDGTKMKQYVSEKHDFSTAGRRFIKLLEI